MSNHAPGPWYAVKCANWWNLQRFPDYEAANLLDSEDFVEAEANAKLAARAPELLARNAELLEACKAMASKDHDFVDAIQMLEAAIKKAEGE